MAFPENLPSGWKQHLAPEAGKEYFRKLSGFLRTEYQKKKPIFPSRDRVLHALQEVDFENVRVVILGQDPYHGEGQAIGCCFAVPNNLAKKPPSLLNIYKEIETDLGKKVDRTKSELSHWVSQGVLLLNTVLTVRSGEAHSHKGQGWETFTNQIISLLNSRTEPLIFILWGGPARSKKELITGKHHRIIESAHPSPLSAYNGFFGSKPFSKANAILRQWGKPAIDWEITA